MKNLFFSIIFFLFISSQPVFAESIASGSSATLEPTLPVKKADVRVMVLQEFLKKYNSPLTEYASVFIETADTYNLDWRLVAAISGLESTFGRFIPYNSYNGWGWGVYGNNVIRFASWDEGIKTVSAGLRENYLDKWGATNVYEIGRIYAASPTWAQRVSYLMEKITEFQLKDPNSLSISL